MKRMVAVALVLSGVAAPSFEETSTAAERKKSPVGTWALYVPNEVPWKAGPDSLPPGAKVAVLEGDPSKEGFFTMRILLPEGYRVAPHWHPKTERLNHLRYPEPRDRRPIRSSAQRPMKEPV